MHVIEGTDWKDAAIALLKPDSSYRPWRRGPDPVEQGDLVLALLPTDPVSLLTCVGRIGADGDATFEPNYAPFSLVEAATFLATVHIPLHRDPRRSWRLTDLADYEVKEALDSMRFWPDPAMRFGHTTFAAANILLHSNGVCTGCDNAMDLRAADARDRIHIHTLDTPARGEEPVDWPAALCTQCWHQMGGNFLDFRFARHPRCPNCHAHRTLAASYGMPVIPDFPPWVQHRGCCVIPERWTCSECEHSW